MHGTSQGVPVPLSGLGGLVTLAKPESVPEGASPRTYDTDFNVGSAKTRAGLTGAITYSGSSVGPSGGGHAVDTSLSAAVWTNPGNVLVNIGTYATATIPYVPGLVLNIASVQTIPAGPHGQPGQTLVTFTTPPPSGNYQYAFSGLTNFTDLNGQQLPALFVSGNTVTFQLVGLGGYGPASDTGIGDVGIPVYSTDALDITQFGFSIPSTSSPLGFVVDVKAFGAGATLSVQMLKAGVPVGNAIPVPLGSSVVTIPFGGSNNLFGASWAYSDLNNTGFGVRITATSTSATTVSVGYVTLQVYIAPAACNMNWVGPFVAQNGDVKNLYLDADGNFWVEDVTNNQGVLTLALEGITPGSYAVGVNGPDVEYVAISNGQSGSDMPLQWTPRWIDRITQVGPGAAPAFSPIAANTNTFAIATIAQPAANSDITDPGNISVLMWSAGPSSTAPGNVITVFYSPSFYSGAPQPAAEDTILVNAFNSGNPVYVYISGTAFGAGTYLVTSVGNALPPGVDHFRYYFTVQALTSNYQRLVETPGQYQMSLATMTTSVPVPGLEVGNNITIASASVPAWDTQWQISQTLNSGVMQITATSVTGSVATYSYSVVSGANPVAGQLVTITNTENANGALNGTNLTIVSVSGGSSGTFTVNVSVTSASTVPEDGQASTAGTIFAFDPGVGTVGTMTSPILGNSTGGTLTFVSATAQLIGVGTRQGSVIFITRNGYYTAPAPAVTFTCPENTTALAVTQIPVGPPNVIARGIILTEPGQNGVPGANFFLIPTPVTYIVSNVSYTASALIINDNTSTSATFSFTDSVLLNALAVDVYGYNLFNQIEIGDPGWVVSYAGRNFYGLCWNKVQNFNNLSFDGGYLPSGQLAPLGWSQPDIYGQLVVSPKFGNAYYIQNTSGSTKSIAGLISQTAFQDAYQQPIIQPNTTYSIRVTARIPSSNTTGNLVVSLTGGGIVYGSFTLPFASMNSSFAIYSGTLLTTQFTTVPPNLILTLSATAIANGADVEIDRVELYPTDIPILTTTVYGSYAGLPEQVDSVTGQVGFSSENQQPINGAMVMYDTFYGLKAWGGKTPGSSLYSLQKSSNLEPAQWDEPEVAQKSGGAIGINSFDLAEQWFLGASRSGLYLFEGGQPGKINQEIYQVWDAINWSSGSSIWARVDITHRKIFVGVPMATPNFWLPNASVNANPTSPNVILMCNYQGLDSGQEVKAMPEMHTTMFGTLNAIDMRRKWSIWQIPSPYAQFVQGATDQELYICNGRANSKVYFLDEANETDDGMTIDSLYTTAGFVEQSKRTQMQGIGWANTRTGFIWAALESLGNISMRLLPNRLLYPEPANYNVWTVAGGFSPGKPALYDCKCSANFWATRTFVEIRENDGFGFSLSNFQLHMKKDPWNATTGSKTV